MNVNLNPKPFILLGPSLRSKAAPKIHPLPTVTLEQPIADQNLGSRLLLVVGKLLRGQVRWGLRARWACGGV